MIPPLHGSDLFLGQPIPLVLHRVDLCFGGLDELLGRAKDLLAAHPKYLR